jgi:hypothetical protein
MITAQSPGAEQGGAHHLHVAVAGGQAGHAQAKELVLRVLGHDARVARAVELDAPARLPGRGDGLRRLLYGGRAGGVAVLQEGGHGMGALGQFAHRLPGKGPWIGQHQAGHALFGGSKRGQRGGDAVQHVVSRWAEFYRWRGERLPGGRSSAHFA